MVSILLECDVTVQRWCSFCCVLPCVADVGVDYAVRRQSNKRRLLLDNMIERLFPNPNGLISVSNRGRLPAYC